MERGGYAQQDAEECWGVIISALRNTLSSSNTSNASNNNNAEGFIKQYMTGELVSTYVTLFFNCTKLMTLNQSRLKCNVAESEEATVSTDEFIRLTCHISRSKYVININYNCLHFK
jgi:ubiquitin carboxyl-terminal hydrolase 14